MSSYFKKPITFQFGSPVCNQCEEEVDIFLPFFQSMTVPGDPGKQAEGTAKGRGNGAEGKTFRLVWGSRATEVVEEDDDESFPPLLLLRLLLEGFHQRQADREGRL